MARRDLNVSPTGRIVDHRITELEKLKEHIEYLKEVGRGITIPLKPTSKSTTCSGSTTRGSFIGRVGESYEGLSVTESDLFLLAKTCPKTGTSVLYDLIKKREVKETHVTFEMDFTSIERRLINQYIQGGDLDEDDNSKVDKHRYSRLFGSL